MTTENSRAWPFTAARSAGEDSHELLSALLVAGTLDEISNAEDYASVEMYIRNQGRVDEAGKTTCGVTFWLYPTGLYGPYHVSDTGSIEKHGTLITIEKGTLVAEAVRRARAAFKTDGIAHEHISC